MRSEGSRFTWGSEGLQFKVGLFNSLWGVPITQIPCDALLLQLLPLHSSHSVLTREKEKDEPSNRFLEMLEKINSTLT